MTSENALTPEGYADLKRELDTLIAVRRPELAKKLSEAVAEGDRAFLVWDFTFKVRRWQPGVERRIHGASYIRFDAAGKVELHRDYWDAGEELYEKLPVFGALVRWVRRKMG